MEPPYQKRKTEWDHLAYHGKVCKYETENKRWVTQDNYDGNKMPNNYDGNRPTNNDDGKKPQNSFEDNPLDMVETNDNESETFFLVEDGAIPNNQHDEDD